MANSDPNQFMLSAKRALVKMIEKTLVCVDRVKKLLQDTFCLVRKLGGKAEEPSLSVSMITKPPNRVQPLKIPPPHPFQQKN